MKHRDIDFHVYTPRLNVAESFRAMTRLAENPRIVKTEYVNLTAEEDACLEWHAWYQSDDGNTWQIDMIHMAEGCRWDGYFEKFADRINAAAGAEERKTILRLKYETPDDAKIAGIEYYMAVLRDGIENYDDFVRWRQQQKRTASLSGCRKRQNNPPPEILVCFLPAAYITFDVSEMTLYKN